jgi:hypothetical protein
MRRMKRPGGAKGGNWQHGSPGKEEKKRAVGHGCGSEWEEAKRAATLPRGGEERGNWRGRADSDESD